MKIAIEIHDDAVDKLVVAALKVTLRHHTDPEWIDEDSAEIATACKTLLEYYRIPPR